MEWHRVKNIIIVILLLINGFLLALVGAQRSEARRYEQSALDGAIAVLAKNGITLSEDAILGRTGQNYGTIERSIPLEGAAASALLGEGVESANRGGGLYIYTNDGGQISFRSGGEVSTVLKEHSRWYTDDPEAHAAELAVRLGVELRPVSVEISEGSGTIVYQQEMDGVPLFSCRVTFTYEDRHLTALNGTLFASEEPAVESGEALSLSTVLMQVLDEVLTSGSVSSEIRSVEPGWLPEQSFNDTVHLTPVWYISTNTADYYVDGVTGEVSRAAESGTKQ